MNPIQAVEKVTLAVIEQANAAGGPQPFELPVEEGRALFASRMAAAPARRPARIDDLEIDGGAAGAVSIRLIRPEPFTAPAPALLYLHGGGWVLGDRHTHDRFSRELAYSSGAAVVFVDYHRAPEARFPVALEQTYAVARHIARNGRQFGLDPDRLAVIGDSAGGNLAAALTLLARRRGGPAIAHQTLICPVMDTDFDTPSYRQFASGYLLSRDAMRWFWDQYAPSPDIRSLPEASPLRAGLDEMAGLPPALVLTAELDVLRDEGEAYARKLMRAGVPVTASRTLGAIHNFVVQPVVCDSAHARAAMAMLSAWHRQAWA